MTKSRKFTIGLAVVMFALGATAAGAVTGGTSRTAGSQTAIQVATQRNPTGTSSNTFIALPGGTTTFTATAKVLLVATFSAESDCSGSGSGSWCSVRILVDRTEMEPAVGTEFAFDSVEIGGDGLWSGASMQRSLLVGPGKHTVAVQLAVSGSASFSVDDWQLTTTESANPA